MKADYLELDVRMTKDGLLAVIHDETIDRTTNGSGLVKNFTYEELKQFDAGAWFHRKFSGEKIPLLCDVLKKYRGKINFLIEVKEPKKQFGIVERLAKELIEKGDQQLNVVVQSFDTAFYRNSTVSCLRFLLECSSDIDMALLRRSIYSNMQHLRHISIRIKRL